MHVTYHGTSDKSDLSTEYHVRDAEGKMHVLLENIAADVPDELGSELVKDAKDRDKRFAGHKFDASTEEEIKQAGLEPTPAEKPDPERAPRTGAGTTTAAART